MLHICGVSGQPLESLDLASFHQTLPEGMPAVRALKQRLHSKFGLSKFRQSLFYLFYDEDGEGG